MNKFTKILSLFAIFCMLFFLEAQDFNSTGDNPNVDRPVYRENFDNILPPLTAPMIVTTPDGFDNFTFGTAFAECEVAMNLQNPLKSTIVYNVTSISFGGTVFSSTDGGITFPSTNPAWGFPMRGDVVPAIDSLGNVFVENLYGTATTIAGSKVAVSTNHGATWTISSGNVGSDKNWIAADQTGGPFANYIYGTITNASGTACNVMRSTDHGLTFNLTTSLYTHGLPGAMPCVGPNGNTQGGSVFVVTNAGSSFNSTYTFFRSTDGGVTFQTQSSQNFSNFVGTNVGGRNSVENMRTRPYPFIAADNSYGTFRGRLYCVYASNNPTGDLNKPDIFCRFSTDFGTNWSGPVVINDDASSENNNQWQPAIWCDKTTGRLYAQWMDTRNCPTHDSCEIYASYSTDGGATFVTNQKISNAKMKINCPSCGGGGVPAYQGDYSGIVSNALTSLICWTDFRAANFGNYAAYMPDYAMRLSPTTASLNGISDSSSHTVSIPGIKLYTDRVKFTATINPTPGTGTVLLQFFNKNTGLPQDSLTTYPDSLKFKITTLGGVTGGNYTVTVKGSGSNGTPVHVRNITLTVAPIGIHNISTEVPENFYLYQNYPNPFNPTTNINFDIAKAGNVKLVIYNLTGQEVSVPVNSNYSAGRYNVDFNAENLASGIYFYKLETPEFTSIRKMILLK